jgi:hypothetical protein
MALADAADEQDVFTYATGPHWANAGAAGSVV